MAQPYKKNKKVTARNQVKVGRKVKAPKLKRKSNRHGKANDSFQRLGP